MKSNHRSLQLALLLCVVGLALGLTGRTGVWHPLDLTVSHFIQKMQPAWFVTLAQAVSLAEFALVLLLPCFGLYFLFTHQPAPLYLILFAAVSLLVPHLLKLAFGLPCPTTADVMTLYPFRSLSNLVATALNIPALQSPPVCYPSGHVFNYTVVWGTLYIVAVNRYFRWFCLFLILTVGLARIAVGAHWLIDILGGYLFGSAWLIIGVHLFRYHRSPE